MVIFGLGLRVAKIKHKNHLQLLRQAAVTQVTSRQSYKEGNTVLLGPGYHVTPHGGTALPFNRHWQPSHERKPRNGSPETAAENLQVEQFLARSRKRPATSLTHFLGHQHI